VPVLKSFADGRVFGGTWGSGEPTVLALHGWQRTHLDFSPVFDGLPEADGLSAVGPDLFGFGSTPPPPEPWGTAEYARHLLPLFEEAGVLAERVVVVGHSFGGKVAVRLCGLVPDRIGRVVLTGVPLLDRQGRPARPAATYRLARRLNGLGLLGDARLEALRDRYGSPDYRAAQGVMRGVLVRVLAEQYGEDMASIGCPVDLVWGEEDTEVPLEVAVRARPMFPSATLVTLPGVGHLTPTEAPAQLRDVILGRPVTGPGRPAGAVGDAAGDPICDPPGTTP
jgi:pimeloyl-ACP methyl ester carboxylesterase